MNNDDDTYFLSRLSDIKNQYSSSQYGVILSSRKNSDLKQWLISNTPDDCETLTERMVIVLDGNNPHLCEFGNRKIYKLGKFRYCENGCYCQKRDHKLACEKGKKTRLEKYGSYWSTEMIEKSVETNIEKYGAEHHLKSNKGKEKFKKTIQEKYGDNIISTLQLGDVKEKIKHTNLERYGVEYALQNPDVRDKISKSRIEKYGSYWSTEMIEKSIETYMQNYGMAHHLKSIQGKEKFKKIIQEKYGDQVVSTLQLDDVKEKIKHTNLERYGVEYVLQSSTIKQKIKQSNLQKYGVENFSQIHISPEKLFEFHNDQKFIEIYNSFNYINDIVNYFGVVESTIHQRAKKLGLPVKYNNVSKQEQELADFLSEYTVVEQSNRNLIWPKEIDIWLPEFKLGIEYNGVYYHSINFSKITPEYHLKKTNRMNDLGYRLIHIFSDEWNNKQNIVKSMLLDVLGKNDNIIYAYNTELYEVSEKQAEKFLNENHIKGSCYSDIRYGLFIDNELVSLMAFRKPIFGENYQWELLRFCNKLNTNVIDGSIKLLKYFVENYGNSIISYCDKRWCDYSFYDILGFQKIGDSEPNCIVIENNKIYDCGNSVWALK